MIILNSLVLTVFFIIICTAKIWPKSQHGSDFADAPMVLNASLTAFYDENGKVKEDLLKMRPTECNRTQMIGIQPNELLTFCPTPAVDDPWMWTCLRKRDICDGVVHCPNKEDESPKMCFHYKVHTEILDEREAKLDKLYDEVMGQ